MSVCRSGRLGASAILVTFVLCTTAHAQPEPGYYASFDESSPQALRDSLHAIIDDHQWIPYTDTTTDTWDVLEIADENQDNSGQVITVYRNAAYGKEGGGNSFYNREHSWPKSYGFPNLGSDNYPYTDMHHLFIADSGYNSSRSNKPFDVCGPACAEKPTETNNGRGGAGGGYPGDSNWTTGSFTQGIWEVWNSRRGDIARAMFYMDVRYEGGTHGVTGVAEPDLALTDNLSLIEASNTGSNESVAYMGLLSVLLQWHDEDPVDLIEFQHNEGVAAFQGNRNPFVDNPAWVDCVFRFECGGGTGGDTTPPAAPSGLAAAGFVGGVDLDWFDNGEPDLAGYHVYRADASNGPFARLTGTAESLSVYRDTTAVAGQTHFYRVTAIDLSGNESDFSATAAGTAEAGEPGTPEVFVNELHYDNEGTDTGEFVEVAGPAGASLNGWQLVAYNGNGGTVYATLQLGGTFSDQSGCMGVLSFAMPGLQNGSPDGVALVDGTGSVVEFIAYEGTLTATDGPAAGATATDIGVAETSTTAVGDALGLVGNGAAAANFSWAGPSAASPGLPNNGQTFDGCVADTSPPAAPSGLIAVAGDGQVTLDWDDNIESDLDGYRVWRSTTSGSGYQELTATPVAASGYTDSGVANGTTYYYVVTAVDTSGNESAASPEDNATPTAPVMGGNAWINEFHYDNDGVDVGEFVEIAGEAGLDLSGWQLVLYNGNGGTVYGTINLSGQLGDQLDGHGALAFDVPGLQNGAPDGIALVDGFGDVVEFLSYEGTFVAADGPAAGLTSVDIGIDEPSTTPLGASVQRTGDGLTAAEFAWTGPVADSYGLINAGQSFGNVPPADEPPAAPTGLVATAGRGQVDLDWADSAETDVVVYRVYRSTSSGAGYALLVETTTSAHTDQSVTNGTYYYYVVTAVDAAGQESADSSEVYARPARRGRDRDSG